MRKPLLFIAVNLLCFLPVLLQAQTKADSVKRTIRTAADLKSGNSQDVLISFFQLAFNDLTGPQKSLKFQSSIFAIKAKTDDKLWVDTNYIRQKFARNFVFSVAPQLDTNFRFKGNTIGLKYALINNRDKTVFDFATDFGEEHAALKNAILNQYLGTHPSDADYDKALNFFVDANDPDTPQTPVQELPAAFVAVMQQHMRTSRHFKDLTPEAFRGIMEKNYALMANYVENRGLWTLEGNFSSDNKGKLFSAININTEYLKGMLRHNSKMNIELNLKASMIFGDDTAIIHKPDVGQRQLFSFAGGFNWIILKNKNRKSIIELKGAIAYNNVLQGKYDNEDRSKFTGQGSLRVRITNDIWIPVDIKYDPKNGNVLGFLSIRSNFDWLKKT